MVLLVGILYDISALSVVCEIYTLTVSYPRACLLTMVADMWNAFLFDSRVTRCN